MRAPMRRRRALSTDFYIVATLYVLGMTGVFTWAIRRVVEALIPPAHAQLELAEPVIREISERGDIATLVALFVVIGLGVALFWRLSTGDKLHRDTTTALKDVAVAIEGFSHKSAIQTGELLEVQSLFTGFAKEWSTSATVLRDEMREVKSRIEMAQKAMELIERRLDAIESKGPSRARGS